MKLKVYWVMVLYAIDRFHDSLKMNLSHDNEPAKKKLYNPIILFACCSRDTPSGWRGFGGGQFTKNT
jgi:hypothetical protein